MEGNNEYIHDGGHRGGIGREGSGFLSSILGSISSAGSVNSIEDEKADFHQKNQKFLKRAEKDKAKKKMKILGDFEKSGGRKNIFPDLVIANRK